MASSRPFSLSPIQSKNPDTPSLAESNAQVMLSRIPPNSSVVRCHRSAAQAFTSSQLPISSAPAATAAMMPSTIGLADITAAAVFPNRNRFFPKKIRSVANFSAFTVATAPARPNSVLFTVSPFSVSH